MPHAFTTCPPNRGKATSYGSIGQYFISGYVQPSGYIPPPSAALQVTDILQAGTSNQILTVTYSGLVPIDISTLDNQDIQVTSTNGFSAFAQFVSVDVSSNGTPRRATYSLPAPNGISWTSADNGQYTVWLQTNQVANTGNAFAPTTALGTFSVKLASVIYAAYMNSDPDWTLQPLWQFGKPAYSGVGPTNGATGTNIIAYNLSGNYENRLSTKYATTPAINCSGYSTISLRFQRWLRLVSSDTASIEVSSNGTTWSALWSTTQTVTDTNWQLLQYDLPSWAQGCPNVQIRWGMASGISQNDIGWNIDDVEVVGAPTNLPATFQIVATANNNAWGTVSPSSNSVPSGTAVQITATSANYYRFNSWSGSIVSTNNPLSVVVTSNMVVQAMFSEILTTNFPTPYWWLTSFGFTNFETDVSSRATNGMLLWESYIAGLVPTNPASRLTLTLTNPNGTNWVLGWTSVTGRVYTLTQSTNLLTGFLPISGASNLAPAIQTFSLPSSSQMPASFFRLQVQKP